MVLRYIIKDLFLWVLENFKYPEAFKILYSVSEKDLGNV